MGLRQGGTESERTQGKVGQSMEQLPSYHNEMNSSVGFSKNYMISGRVIDIRGDHLLLFDRSGIRTDAHEVGAVGSKVLVHQQQYHLEYKTKRLIQSV